MRKNVNSISDSPQEAFSFIRKRFFPRWDRLGKWKLCIRRHLKPGRGKCLPERQTIVISSASSNQLVVLIIHEICHAVASQSHGQRWKRRMLKGADTAVALGLSELAEQLRVEVVAYNNPDAPSVSAEIYAKIEDVGYCRRVPPPFRQLAAYLRREYTMTRNEFRTRLPRAALVYRKARQAHKQHQTARAEHLPAKR
jgi:hypothetical protein